MRYEIGERVLPAIRTTPESLDLQELLAQIANAGCKAAAMEVSSHALAQDRTRGPRMERCRLYKSYAGPSRFSRDHGKATSNAKMKLFTGLAESEESANPLQL